MPTTKQHYQPSSPPTPILHANPLHARWPTVKPSPTHPVAVPTQVDNNHNIKYLDDRSTGGIEIQ